MDGTSIIVIATFSVIGLAAVASAVYWLVRVIITLRTQSRAAKALAIRRGDISDEVANESWWGRFVARFRSRAVIGLDDEDDEEEIDPQATTILSAMPMDSVIVTRDGEVLQSSPAAYTLGVVENDSLVDDQIREAVDQAFVTGERATFDVVTHTPVDFIDETARDDDDISDDQQDVDPATLHAVSRRNWLTVSVVRLNASLVAILIEDVSDVKRFNRIRDAFVTNVTEQLLKPTKALEALGAELESAELDEQTLDSYARAVSDQSRNVNHLVSDLLLLLKAQEPVVADPSNLLEMKPLVERVLAHYSADIEKAKVRLHAQIPEGLWVNGQPDQLEGAIGKLVENAIVYSPEGSVVGVAAAVTQTDDGPGVVVRVVDHGIGISKEEQPHIFERFWRGSDQGPRQNHGTGLGLAIVKHVALTHRGSVTVWSTKGEGSTFSFTLPQASHTENASLA